jgi:riboflavin synthase
MFTGVVEAVGRITEARARAGGLRLSIDTRTLHAGAVAVGDSVAVNGCCLTVVEPGAQVLEFDVSAATLACTVGLDAVGDVNLETALRVGAPLGGHIMSGHVDGAGIVTRFEPAPDNVDNRLLEIEVPADLAGFIAVKGSIAVNGVSLTVNAVSGRRFCVNLIPHTLAVTTLKHLAVGARTNLEVDMLARYVVRAAQSGLLDALRK